MNECRGLKSISATRHADAVVVTPVGRVDHPGSAPFAEAIQAARDANPDAKGFVFDLTRLDMITSPGLQALVKMHKGLAAQGGQLRLAGANDLVTEVLQISHLDKIMPVSVTLDEALAKISDAALAHFKQNG